jgi:hypothetical protein
MRIVKKVIQKNMFFGAKAELFALALQMRKNPTEFSSSSHLGRGGTRGRGP